MADLSGVLDAGALQMIAQLDAQIGEMEARGWLFSAAKAEELVCAIYHEAGVPVPPERAERVEAMISVELNRSVSH